MAVSDVLLTPYVKEVKLAGNHFYYKLSTDKQRRFRLVWSIDRDEDNNSAIFTYEVTADSPSSNYSTVTNCYEIKLVVDEREVYNSGQTPMEIRKGDVITSGSLVITYNDNGTRVLPISLSGYVYTVDDSAFASASNIYTLEPNPVYTLRIEEGNNCHIVVDRTSCPIYMRTGRLEDGARLFADDMLKISFSADAGYMIVKKTVNEADFESGGTCIGIRRDIYVSASATPKASLINAKDAYIDTMCRISITQYDEGCRHNLRYSFKDLSGVIVENSDETSLIWLVPSNFYSQIPEEKSGICTITCETYYDSNLIGQSSCDVTISVMKYSPLVSGTVADINETTIYLTGNRETLVRYQSIAECTINSVATRRSYIVEERINQTAVKDKTLTIPQVVSPIFTFKATDARGMSSNEVIVDKSETMIQYIPLSCYPNVYRLPHGANSDNLSPGKTVVMTVSGNMYIGSFGAHNNNLVLQYRYAGSDGVMSEWKSISTDKIEFGNASYKTSSEIVLGEDFEYDEMYSFEIKATDGSDGYVLTSITKSVPVQKFVPLFDWGENDFNFNVPVSIKGVELDYIVEQKESDIWTYRKWNSGKAECWGRYVLTTTIDRAWGSVYVGDTVTGQIQYPIVFTEQPIETVNINADNYAAWIFSESQHTGTNSKTSSGSYNVCRPTAVTIPQTFYINLYVTGRWK